MPRRPRPIVLDSWSVIAYLGDEPGAGEIADLIADAHEQRVTVSMTVVDVGEVWYITAREISEAEADNAIRELRGLRIRFEEADWGLTREAARLKSSHRMSYADCYAAALAARMKADLVTGDPEFKHLEEAVSIRWVGGATAR